MEIIRAESDTQMESIRYLFREYEAFLVVDLCFQGFEAELADLPGRYSPPTGALLLASVNGETAGCVAMRQHVPGTCEMKRLYVRPAYRKQSIGKELALAIVNRAKEAGYSKMVLDTLDHLKAAIGLYTRMGFEKCPPYYENPLPGVTYWELNLKCGESGRHITRL